MVASWSNAANAAAARGPGATNSGPMAQGSGEPLWAHGSACDSLSQPFEQAFKTRQALAKLHLAMLQSSSPLGTR